MNIMPGSAVSEIAAHGYHVFCTRGERPADGVKRVTGEQVYERGSEAGGLRSVEGEGDGPATRSRCHNEHHSTKGTENSGQRSQLTERQGCV